MRTTALCPPTVVPKPQAPPATPSVTATAQEQPPVDRHEGPVSRLVHWLDDYTSPRDSTGGDLHQHDYIQSMLHAVGTGYAFNGLPGIGITSASALACTFVGRKTESRAAAITAGVAAGAAAAAAIGAVVGAPMLATVGTGLLLGGFQALCSDKLARVRDAAEGGTLVTAMFVPGAGKIAGAIAAGVAGATKSTAAAVGTGAVVGAAVGALTAAVGLGTGSILGTALISGLGGAIGPLFGPRFAQGFRNLANDCGHLAAKAVAKTSWGKDVNETTANCIGAFPATLAREVILGVAESDFSVVGLATASVGESIEMAWMFLRSGKHDDKHDGAHEGHDHHGHDH